MMMNEKESTQHTQRVSMSQRGRQDIIDLQFQRIEEKQPLNIKAYLNRQLISEDLSSVAQVRARSIERSTNCVNERTAPTSLGDAQQLLLERVVELFVGRVVELEQLDHFADRQTATAHDGDSVHPEERRRQLLVI